MKLFISADIEGCAGITLSQECHKNESVYQAYAKEMTDEVIAVCEAAFENGVDEIVVKDGHGDASNIDPLRMPENVTLIRGKSGHPINMMFGIDESFDAAMFVGYHAPAGSDKSPLAHTSTGNTNYIYLNGNIMSEYMLNSYTAAMYGVPVIFISGDEEICEQASAWVPAIETVSTKKGVGASVFNKARATVLKELKEGVKTALQNPVTECTIDMPKSFEYIANYKDLKKAYQMSFFPGMRRVDAATNCLETDNYMDVVVAHSFVVY